MENLSNIGIILNETIFGTFAKYFGKRQRSPRSHRSWHQSNFWLSNAIQTQRRQNFSAADNQEITFKINHLRTFMVLTRRYQHKIFARSRRKNLGRMGR